MFNPQDGYIAQAKWPSPLGDGTVNELAIEEIQYLVKVTHEFRVRFKENDFHKRGYEVFCSY